MSVTITAEPVHDWRFVFSTGEDEPNRSLDTLYRCLSCGAIRHDYAHGGGLTSPHYPIYNAAGVEENLSQEPPCRSAISRPDDPAVMLAEACESILDLLPAGCLRNKLIAALTAYKPDPETLGG